MKKLSNTDAELKKSVAYTKRRVCGVLRDFVPFVQFKKREKHSWRSVTSPSNFTKSNTPPWVFSRF